MSQRKSLPVNLRILILRYSSLGDVILTNPVLDQLSKEYPTAKIFFATKSAFAPVVAYHPAVSQTIPLTGGGMMSFLRHFWAIRALKPTLVLDLHNSIRTRLLRWLLTPVKVLVYDKETIQRRLLVKKLRLQECRRTVRKYLDVLEPLGISIPQMVSCQVHVSKAAQAVAEVYLRDRISKTRWVIGWGPGSRWGTKQWPPAYYAELASRLVKSQKAQLLWFGNEREAELIRFIQDQMRVPNSQRGFCLAGELTLEHSIALIGRCNHFIGNDSGLIHLASGRGVPVTVLYGSTTPSLGFEPLGTHQVVEIKGLDCRPCDVHGRNVCPLGHFKCMKELTPDRVESQIEKFVGKRH